MKKIAIIGGGIVGMTTAAYLAPFFDVTVYDAELGQATKAAAGIISPWLSKRRNKQWYRLARNGAQTLADLSQVWQLPQDVYQNSGTLILRKDPAELAALAEERVKEAPLLGTTKLLSKEEITEKIPFLKPDSGGLWISGGAYLDGARYIAHLRETLSADWQGEAHILDLKEGIIAAEKEQAYDFVVLASGAWLGRLLEPLGYHVAVRPQKGQLMTFASAVDSSLPATMLDGEGNILPLQNGDLLVGATHENDQGFDLTPTLTNNSSLIQQAQRFVTFPLVPKTTRVGIRAYTPDFAPFFGALPEHPHVLVASGLGSSGLTTGPEIARQLAAYIKDGTPFTTLDQKPLQNYLWPE